MEFFLKFNIDPPAEKLSYNEKLMLIGSCFSKEIGDRLHELKWNVFQNPAGIIYNPLSIAQTILNCIDCKKISERDLDRSEDVWHSWQQHSVFSGLDKNEVVSRINETTKAAHEFLKHADRLILTPATSFVYQLKSNDEVVANCHKFPADHFEKRMLSHEEISSAMLNAIEAAKAFNPKLKFIITISPVKHLRDGIIENNRSKANLIMAVNEILKSRSDIYYFPSYEIMNDELRDYRFYKNDFAHPNETAVSYIFERFVDCCMNEESKILLKHIKDIVNASRHRSSFPQSEAHKRFVSIQIQKIESLEKSFPQFNFSAERKLLAGSE